MNNNDIIIQDTENDVYEFIEIVNKGVGCVDESGNLLIIKEPNTNQSIGPEYELVRNKVINFDTPNNTAYPTTLAVMTFVNQNGDKYLRYTQNTPSNIWVIIHNMGKRPSVVVTDNAGTTVEGQITYNDNNQITIEFSVGFSGYAELN